MNLLFLFVQLILSISIYAHPSGNTDSFNVFNDFKQGKIPNIPAEYDDENSANGNCAAIALIKAAIATYGIDSVFSCVEDSDNYYVTLLDKSHQHRKFTLSKAEKDFAVANTGFKKNTSNRFVEYADLCFAVLCKVKQLENNFSSYAEAVYNVNEGEDTRQVYKFLGLKKTKIKSKRITGLENKENLVVWIKCHAVYSSKGIYDESRNSSGKESLSNIYKKRPCRAFFKGANVSGSYSLIPKEKY